VNAIAGAYRRQNQQPAAELEDTGSSTSTSEESSDDEMDTVPVKQAPMETTVSDDVTDAVCDIRTDSTLVNLSTVSQKQDSVEISTAENAKAVSVRQAAVHINVNRTAEIQVLCFLC